MVDAAIGDGLEAGSASGDAAAGLERVVRLVADLLDVPIVAITLAEGERLLVVASLGCPFQELPRQGSLPGCTLDAGAPEIVEDLAALGPEVVAPIVDGRPVRFYAGAPIRGPDGTLVGTVCAADFVPRRVGGEARTRLELLAALAGDQLLLARELVEHRRLAAELARSERRFEDFAETASDWFWEMDAELRFSWLSDSVRTRFGLDPAWHYGKTRLEIAATEADRAVAERVQALMLRREPFRDFEYCRRSPAGDHWLRISGKPVFDADGRFLGYRGTGRDVTELRRAEAARREAEERYRRLVEQSPDGVVIHREGRLIFANAKAIEILGGRTLEDVLGVSTVELCAPEARAIIAERIRRLAEPGTVLEPFEFRLRRLDGRWIDVETRGVTVEEAGAPAAQVVIRDVTERRRAERALREAETRYRTLFELSPDAVFVKDAAHRILFANAAAAEIFGLSSADALIGRTSLEFLDPRDRAIAEQRTRKLLERGGVAPPVELRILRPDGQERIVEALATRIEDKGEARILVVYRDITERRAAERARLEAETRYRALVELSPDPVILVEEGCFVFANAPAARLFGVREPAELVGRSVFEFVPEPLHAAVRARHATPLREGEALPPFELEILRADGARVEIEAKGSLVVEGGRRMLLGVLRDIGARKAAERALREAEERYRLLVELAPVGILVWREGGYRFANRAAAEILGADDPRALLGVDPFELITEPYRETIRERAARVMATGATAPPIEIEMRRLDGRLVTVETVSAAIREAGRPAVQIVIRDITERRRAERALQEAEARWRALVELGPEAVTLLKNGVYVFANERAVELFGAKSAEEIVGRTPADFILPESWPLVEERIRHLLERGGRLPPAEIRVQRLDGVVIDVETAGAAILDGGVPVVQAVMRDISERKALEAELWRRAHHDPLTGLPNRLLFFDRLGQLLALAEREGRTGALLLLDLDGFKAVNDAHGHDAGDALLRAVARRLRRVIRRSDTLARLAGDEFALLLYPVADPAVVARVGERIARALAPPVRHQGRMLRTGASLGAALFPEDGDEPEALVKSADVALYRAKEGGRGHLCFLDRPMRAELERRRVLVDGLRWALERGELALLWQPRVELESERPVALEAFPHWPGAPAGPLDWAGLLRLADDSGLAVELAECAVGLVLDRLVAWQCEGLPPLPASLDLSAAQLALPDLAERISAALASRGLPAQRLAVHVLEEALSGRNGGAALRTLARLRTAGVAVVLDGFGSGPASLRLLAQGPVDGVVLAAGPALALSRDGRGERMIRAVADLARGLGLELAASCIVSAEQKEALRALGCALGQGPLWAEPEPTERARGWLLRAVPPPCACALSDPPIPRHQA